MIRICAAAATAAVAVCCVAGPAIAQRSTNLALGGGVAVPTGRFDSLYTAGPAGMIAIVRGSPTFPIGVRVDYTYAAFRGKTIAGVRHGDLHYNSVSANVVLTLPSSGYVRPYLLAGGGWYPVRDPGATRRENRFGLDAGIGLTFPVLGAAGFIEGRFNDVSDASGLPDRHFAPLMVGLLL